LLVKPAPMKGDPVENIIELIPTSSNKSL